MSFATWCSEANPSCILLPQRCSRANFIIALYSTRNVHWSVTKFYPAKQTGSRGIEVDYSCMLRNCIREGARCTPGIASARVRQVLFFLFDYCVPCTKQRFFTREYGDRIATKNRLNKETSSINEIRNKKEQNSQHEGYIIDFFSKTHS